MSNHSPAYFAIFSTTSLKEAMKVCDMLLASGVPATMQTSRDFGTGEIFVMMPSAWEFRACGLIAQPQRNHLPLGV